MKVATRNEMGYARTPKGYKKIGAYHYVVGGLEVKAVIQGEYLFGWQVTKAGKVLPTAWGAEWFAKHREAIAFALENQ